MKSTAARVRRFGLCAVVAGAGLALLAGCGIPHEEPDVETANYVGESLAKVGASSSKLQLVIYDFSKPVLGKEPTYTGGSPAGQWTVVAQCTPAEPVGTAALALGVLPRDAVTREIGHRA